jgi:hypothetical protein
LTVEAIPPRIPILIAVILIAVPMLSIAPAAAESGGPDSHGYIWVDSRTPSPIYAYNYVDIAASGSRLTLSDDGCTFEVSLDFQFRFYGTIFDQVFICSNGFITFAVPDSYFADLPIPAPATPNNRIVALGIDLNPGLSGGGDVYIKSYPFSTPRRFVIAWEKVYKIFTTQEQTFEIILEQNELSKDGRIIIQYEHLEGLSGMPLVGIENATGSSGLIYPGPLEDQLAVAFLPPSDAAPPPDQLQVSASSIAPPTAAQGSTDVPMMMLNLSVPTNDVLVKAIEVNISGQGAGTEDVNKARLWLDDGNGSFDPGSGDIAISESRFGEVSLIARLSCSVPVTMVAHVLLFISFDIDPTADVDDWIGARLTGANSISVEFPDNVGSVGLPFDTYVADNRTQIVASQDTLMLTDYTPLSPSSVAQWATDVPVLSMQLDADQNLVDIDGMEVMVGGDGNASDVWAIKVLQDLDGDGLYTHGTDLVLAIGSPNGTPASARLNFSLRVVSGSPVTFLVLIDVTPDAVVGHIMNVSVAQTGILLPAGSIDIISVVNFPSAGGEATVVPGMRPTLNLPWPNMPSRPDRIWQDTEYLLDPESTVSLDVPEGNRIPGYLTLENNATHLFIAIDAGDDLTPAQTDGVAIGFDTDADGSPTPGADDVFAVNETEGWHLRYDSSNSTWKEFGSCLAAPPTGDITVPSCSAGLGATAFSTKPHRFYEVAIPLSFLGVTIPIPPGTALRFAVASPPYDGLLAAGNHSTWPMLFSPFPPLKYFGELVLARGFTPNRAPALDWVGDTGFETDGLDPESGTTNTTFLWRISYSDIDDNPPAVGQPLLHVLFGGAEIAGGPFRLIGENVSDHDFQDGKLYRWELPNLQCDGDYSYYFSVIDSGGLTNTSQTKSGPEVQCPDQPPILQGRTVFPVQGIAGETFTYRVVYQDPEGIAPASILVFISRGGLDLTSAPLTVMGWIGDPDNYSTGALFEASVVLTDPGLNYSFQFEASDNNSTVRSPIFFGPYVLPKPPDILSVAGVDLAPLIVDEGARLVPFMQLFLFTSAPDINVTSIRVDCIGTATDADVYDVLLYNDLDHSYTLTGPDQLLGASAPSSGTVTFPLSLQVTQPTSTSLLLLVDLARPGTADATIGLEVKDSSYVAVESGDFVQTFAAIRSTRALINVHPEALNLKVDGHAAGSDGVSHIRPDTHTLEWQFQDANSGDMAQIAFNASVSLVSPSTLLWYDNATGGAMSVAYSGPALSEGADFLMSVSVYDGRLWSASAGLSFRTNTAPPVPLPISPANGTTDLDPNVTLVWQPVTDADGDPVTYHYWVSEDEGFSTSTTGTSSDPTVILALAEGNTYFWKLGVMDGWEYRGNASTWRFSTSGVAPPPINGEVRGRVMNATLPLSGALVELLANDSVILANITESDGVFRFLNLELRLYTVRVSAFGFEMQTLVAEPRPEQAVVDLGDISLMRVTDDSDGPPDDSDGTTPYEIPAWLLILMACLALAFVAVLIVLTLVLRRQRSDRKEEPTSEKKEEDGITRHAEIGSRRVIRRPIEPSEQDHLFISREDKARKPGQDKKKS